MIAAAERQQQTAAGILAALARQGAQLTQLSADSRTVTLGCGFAAYPGEAGDGRDYLAQAIAAGAAAVLWEQRDFAWPQQWAALPNVPVADLKNCVGEIAAVVYGKPSEKLWMIGVTGTNGKTSCAHWLAQSLSGAGRRSAVLGTLGNGFPAALTPSPNTTPDAIVLQQALAGYLAQGAQVAVMEVSSHGLAQGRVNGVRFDVAVLTNLTRDHLDYHGDMASYAAAKATLFQWPGLRYAVLNLDDEFGRALADQLHGSSVEAVGYGMSSGRVRGSRLKFSASGLYMRIESDWGSAQLAAPLLGGFNAYNLLATLATLLVSGVPLCVAVQQLAAIKPVAGRMQALGGAGKPVVVVDYAHTPDALEKTLEALRQVAQERGGLLWCVFGCGGDRDPGKRPQMGAVAQIADHILVTSDNPRSEEPAHIIAQVVAGIDKEYQAVEDRATAILLAVKNAGKQDVILLAGKGHEPYQEIKGKKIPFSDADHASLALTARLTMMRTH